MADVTTITRTALHTTPTSFSLHSFEGILMRMEYTAILYEDLRRVPQNDPVGVECMQEKAADSWVATETAAFNFLRSHHRPTAVPLLVDTVRALVELLDLETGEHPSIGTTMNAALDRPAKSAPKGPERALLARAIPLVLAIATIQSEMFGTNDICAAA